MTRKPILSALALAASFAFAGAYAQSEASTDNDNDVYASTAEFPASSARVDTKSAVDELREQIYRDMLHE